MARYIIEGPDGQQYEVEGPDGLTPEPQPAAPSKARQIGTDFIAGFGKMAAEAPRALGWLAAPGEAGAKRFENFAGETKKFYEGLSKKGQAPGYGKTIAESIGGGMAAGGFTPGGIAVSAASGAGSELAANLLGDSALSRAGGAILGGGLAAGGLGAASRRSPNAEALGREVLDGIDATMLQRASQFQKEQSAKGVQVDLAQALEAVGAPASDLTTIRNFLANKPQGKQVKQVLRDQPGQLSMEADQAAARLPGTNYGYNQSANNLQEAATRAVRGVEGQRTAAVQPFYGAAGTVPKEKVKEIEDAVRQFIATGTGATDDVVRAAGTFLDKLRGGQNQLAEKVNAAREKLAKATDAVERGAAQRELAAAKQELDKAANRPISALDLDTWIGELNGAKYGNNLTPPMGAKAAGQLKGLIGEVNKKFASASDEIRRGREEYQRLSETLVNPVKQSATGQIATRRGYQPDVQATMTKFEALMERGTDAQAKISDIRTLGTQLARADKEAFADALKNYVSARIRKAMEPGGTPQTAANNEDMAARIAKNLWGDELKAQGLRDAVEIAARTQGQDPAAAVRGLDNLMQLTKALQSRPSSVGGLMPEDVFRIGGRNVGADTLRVFGFLPFERAARRLEDTVLGSTLKQFDTILTSPDGAKLLADLGRESVMSRKIPMLLGAFGGQVATNPAGIMPQ